MVKKFNLDNYLSISGLKSLLIKYGLPIENRMSMLYSQLQVSKNYDKCVQILNRLFKKQSIGINPKWFVFSVHKVFLLNKITTTVNIYFSIHTFGCSLI